MSRFVPTLAAFCLSAQFGFAGAAEPEPSESPVAQETAACAGVANENTKKRALMRELAAYIGQTVPEELRDRARKHVEQVIAMKEECDRAKRLAAAGK